LKYLLGYKNYGRLFYWGFDLFQIQLKIFYGEKCKLCLEKFNGAHFFSCKFLANLQKSPNTNKSFLSKLCLWRVWWKYYNVFDYKRLSNHSIIKWSSNLRVAIHRTLNVKISKITKKKLNKTIEKNSFLKLYNPLDWNIFTDGSLDSTDPLNIKCGFGWVIFYKDLMIDYVAVSLKGCTSIFWAETLAILSAICWSNTYLKDHLLSVKLWSDSKSAIDFLNNNNNNPILEWLKYHKLDLVQIKKVPSHVNILGNELADYLAKNSHDIKLINTSKFIQNFKLKVK